MAYVRNRFRNAATGDTYEWHVNHSEEQELGKERSIEHTGLSGGFLSGSTGVVRQVGLDSPMVLSFTGTIFHAAQHQEMIDWFQLCRTQTVEFRDFTGDEYEVLITSFKPIRKRTLRNPRDPSIPLHYWTYTITMEVIRFISGDWEGVAA